MLLVIVVFKKTIVIVLFANIMLNFYFHWFIVDLSLELIMCLKCWHFELLLQYFVHH